MNRLHPETPAKYLFLPNFYVKLKFKSVTNSLYNSWFDSVQAEHIHDNQYKPKIRTNLSFFIRPSAMPQHFQIFESILK